MPRGGRGGRGDGGVGRRGSRGVVAVQRRVVDVADVRRRSGLGHRRLGGGGVDDHELHAAVARAALTRLVRRDGAVRTEALGLEARGAMQTEMNSASSREGTRARPAGLTPRVTFREIWAALRHSE